MALVAQVDWVAKVVTGQVVKEVLRITLVEEAQVVTAAAVVVAVAVLAEAGGPPWAFGD